MALSPEQQVQALIERAGQILIITSEHPSIDAMSAALALGFVLQKMHKTFDLVIPKYSQDIFRELVTAPIPVRAQTGPLRQLAIELDAKDTPLNELSYEVSDGTLRIHLIPKTGQWLPEQVRVQPGRPRYDLVLAIEAPDRVSLGPLGREHAEVLLQIPTVTFSRHPGHEYWGQINLVNLTAASVTEVIYHWLKAQSVNLIDENVATLLLTGLIAKTKSFRAGHVTPQAMIAASDLLSHGAKRDQIVERLWRTRTVGTLKLWGRALSRLEQDKSRGITWTWLNEADLLETKTQPHETEGIVDELISQAPEAQVVIFFTEQAQDIRVRIQAALPHSAVQLTRPFKGTGSRERALFHVQKSVSLSQTIPEIIQKITAQLSLPNGE